MEYTPQVTVIYENNYQDIFNEIKNKHQTAIANRFIEEENRLISQIRLELKKWNGLNPLRILMQVNNQKEAAQIAATITAKGLPCSIDNDNYCQGYHLQIKFN